MTKLGRGENFYWSTTPQRLGADPRQELPMRMAIDLQRTNLAQYSGQSRPHRLKFWELPHTYADRERPHFAL